MPGESRNNDLLRPQSPEVYRRRRQVALVLLLVVLAIIVGLIWWIVSLFRPAPTEEPPASTPTTSEPTPSDPSASPSPSPSQDASASASPSASASSSEDAAQALNCPSEDLVVSAATDQQVYAEGEDPVLELRVDNTGEESCEANLGTTQQVFTVYSGSDRIFSTEDCQVGSEDAMVEISPDQQERARFTWPRVRSAPNCEEIAAAPGSGTYRLEVSLGDLNAQPVSFTLQ